MSTVGSKTGILSPDETIEPFIGCKIFLFGRSGGDFKSVEATWGKICPFLEKEGIYELLSPRAIHGIRVLEAYQLKKRILPGGPDGVLIRRSRDDGSDTGDAVFLRSREAGWFSTADCPFFVVQDKESGNMVFAHAGRESLISSWGIEVGDYNFKEYPSIVNMAIYSLIGHRNPQDLQVYAGLGISGRHFDHPLGHRKYGKKNKKMIEQLKRLAPSCVLNEKKGQIDLKTLIRIQFEALGVPDSSIQLDDKCTYSDRRWWSYRRSKEQKGDLNARNGILVVND